MVEDDDGTQSGTENLKGTFWELAMWNIRRRTRLFAFAVIASLACLGGTSVIMLADDPPPPDPIRSLSDDDLLAALERDGLPVNATGCKSIVPEINRRRGDAMTRRLTELFQRIEPTDRATTNAESLIYAADGVECMTATPAMKLIEIIRLQRTDTSRLFLTSLLGRNSPLIVSVVLQHLSLVSSSEDERALGELRSVFSSLLANGNAMVRLSAVTVLSRLDCHAKECIETIEAMQRSEKNERVRARMGVALRELRDVEYAMTLVAALDDRDEHKRVSAAEALRSAPSVLDGRYCFREAAIAKFETLLQSECPDTLRAEVHERLEQYRASIERDKERFKD